MRRNKHLKNVDGFKALRFLRPRTAGDTISLLRCGKIGKHFIIGKIQLSTSIHKHRGTSKGADVKIINRELSLQYSY